MSDISGILAKLKGVKRNGDGWKALCPCHDDKNPSLSINRGDNGQVLLYCHAGCEYENIAASLGLKAGRGSGENFKGVPIVDHYDYHDKDGQFCYQVCRTASKEFPTRTRNGNKWKWGMNGQKPILYRLPELLKSDGTIYIVEGEKDANSLRSIGLTATCNPGGAGKWPSCCKKNPDFERPLYGREIVLCGDNDEPGRAHVNDEKESLCGKAMSIKVEVLPLVQTKMLAL